MTVYSSDLHFSIYLHFIQVNILHSTIILCDYTTVNYNCLSNVGLYLWLSNVHCQNLTDFPPFSYLSCFCRACYGVLRFIMESGAKGCEVVVSGKLRGQRAKSMKFVDGLMIHSGDPINDYVDTAVRHVLLRQGNTHVKVNKTVGEIRF